MVLHPIQCSDTPICCMLQKWGQAPDAWSPCGPSEPLPYRCKCILRPKLYLEHTLFRPELKEIGSFPTLKAGKSKLISRMHSWMCSMKAKSLTDKRKLNTFILIRFWDKDGNYSFICVFLHWFTAHVFEGKTRKCENTATNFWRNPHSSVRYATVVPRRNLTAEKAGIFTGTSCGTPTYKIKDIFLYF